MYEARGFYPAPAFRELGRRMALPEPIVTAELERFRAPAFLARTEDLVRRSHLTPAAQEAYLLVVRDRVCAIGQDEAHAGAEKAAEAESAIARCATAGGHRCHLRDPVLDNAPLTLVAKLPLRGSALWKCPG